MRSASSGLFGAVFCMESAVTRFPAAVSLIRSAAPRLLNVLLRHGLWILVKFRTMLLLAVLSDTAFFGEQRIAVGAVYSRGILFCNFLSYPLGGGHHL